MRFNKRLDKQVDTLHTVETPEGAILQFSVAGPVVRGLAWLIDMMIRAAIMLALMFTFSSAVFREDSSQYMVLGLFLIAYFLVTWLYTTLFEMYTGTTPGKRFFKLRVIHDNATPLTATGALLRNFLRAIDNLPFFNLVGLFCMLIDNRFRRIGDLAAGTIVIYQDKPMPIAPILFEHSAPPPQGLSREEKQAIVDFAERSDSLSAERQHEIATHLTFLMEPEDEPVSTVKSWAQWILRGQSNVESAGV